MGSLNLLKGIQDIINVAKSLESEDKDIEFTFVGKPNDIEDEKWVDQIKTLRNAIYIESIPHIEINNAYKDHDIFIFQPICEGFGMVTLEAMSCGLPCIVSQGGKGIISHGETGFINANRDIKAMKEKILFFKNNKGELKRMGDNAYEAAQYQNWNKYSEDISNIYKELLGETEYK